MLPPLPAALLGGLIALVSFTANAQGPATVAITDAYVRAVPPGQPHGAAFLTLTNGSGEPRALVAAASPVAETVELHTHLHADGMMRMRRVEQIEIPPHGSVSLRPGGLHLMLIGLRRQLAPGDQVDLDLSLDDGTQIRITVPVRHVEPAQMTH